MAMHSRIVEIETSRACSFQGDFEKVVGVLFSNPYGKNMEEAETTQELEALHLPPRGLKTEEDDDSETDFEAEDQEDQKKHDPSEGLPPVVMAKE